MIGVFDAKARMMAAKTLQQRSDAGSKFAHVSEHSIERLVDGLQNGSAHPSLAPIFVRRHRE